MADTIEITPGTGVTIATQDVGGVHYQEVKLAESGDTSTAPLSKPEDSAHATGDHGLVALAVRRDTATVGSSTDGDYSTLNVNSVGRLYTSTTIDAAIPAGTNAIGKLAANSGVDIGDVDVQSVVPGTGATNLGKAEDAAHASGDTGVMALGVRQDANASLVGTDGDYAPLQVDATGSLKVAIISGAGSGGTALTDEATFTEGTSSFTPIGGVYNDSLASDPGAGEAAALRITSDRALHVNLRGATGAQTGDTATSPLSVRITNGTAYVAPGTDYTHDEALTPGTTTGPVLMGRGSSATPTAASADNDATMLWLDLNGRAQVNLNAVGGTALPAHDAADAGPGIKITAKAETALSGATLVADGDRTDLYAAADGVLITRNVCLEDVVQERATNTDGAPTAFVSGLAAPTAGIRLWIKSVTIANSAATFCTVDLRDGVGGTVLWTFPVPATGGVTHTFDPPLRLTAATALAYDASAATSTLTISANGFKSKL